MIICTLYHKSTPKRVGQKCWTTRPNPAKIYISNNVKLVHTHIHEPKSPKNPTHCGDRWSISPSYRSPRPFCPCPRSRAPIDWRGAQLREAGPVPALRNVHDPPRSYDEAARPVKQDLSWVATPNVSSCMYGRFGGRFVIAVRLLTLLLFEWQSWQRSESLWSIFENVFLQFRCFRGVKSSLTVPETRHNAVSRLAASIWLCIPRVRIECRQHSCAISTVIFRRTG